ncbi:hypothetical protein E2320_013355, partial [Naja naja]
AEISHPHPPLHWLERSPALQPQPGKRGGAPET